MTHYKRAPAVLFNARQGLIALLFVSAQLTTLRVVQGQQALVAPPQRRIHGAEKPVPDASNSLPVEASENVLVVTLLDGSIVGVDQSNGARLWTYDSGAPLVSVTQSEGAAAGINIFPGVDGSLYAYHGHDDGKPQLERLPLSLPELVSSSPSMAVDGSVVVGTRVSTVFALHRESGQLIRMLSGVGGSISDASGGLHFHAQFDPDNMILVGREDFIVRSLQAKTGQETWNATFARVMHLPSFGQAAAVGGSSPGALDPPGANKQLPPNNTLRFAVGADNTLQAHDTRTGLRAWALQFDAPPVAAFDACSASDGLNRLDPKNSPQSLPGNAQPAGHVMVGVLRGSLYAIPTDHLICAPGLIPGALSLPDQNGAVALPKPMPGYALPTSGCYPLVTGPPGQLELPAASSSDEKRTQSVIPIKGDEDDYDGPQSTALAIVPDSQALSLIMQPTDETGSTVTTLICPLGVHTLTARSDDRDSTCNAPFVPWLPSPAPKNASQAAGGGALDGVKQRTPRAPGWHVLAILFTALAAVLMLGVLYLKLADVTGKLSAAQTAAAALASPFQQGASDAAGGSKPGSEGGKGSPGVKKISRASRRSNAVHVRTGFADADAQTSTGFSDRDPDASNHSRASARSESPMSGLSSFGGAADLSNHSRNKSQSMPGQEPSSNMSGVTDGSAGGSASTRVAQQQADGSQIIGRMRVGPGVLGYGSAGTVVFEGMLDGRPVAIKRLLRHLYDLAKKEIDVLIVSDEHPNVVRCFAMEEDREFVYLALERCKSSLAEALTLPQSRALFQDLHAGGPSQHCMQVMSQVVAGLAALHQRGIVHRDLKPHNVLLTDGGRVKLSDMGLSRQLVAEQSSFESHVAGGSSGWQAPEQLMARNGSNVRQTRNMDVFSLGCVLYHCMTAGKHPFGESFERDAAILRGQPNLAPLSSQPEACNLVSAMLVKEAEQRPGMQSVSGHPMWWDAAKRLQFLVDISDRVENEDREPDQQLLRSLEAHAWSGLEPSIRSSGSSTAQLLRNWGAEVDSELVANLGRYRRYDYTSVRDLLRVVRNKRNHYRELPTELQQKLGQLPSGFLKYFTSRFPNLLMAMWVWAVRHIPDEEQFARQYYPGGAKQYEQFALMFLRQHPLKFSVAQAAQTAASSALSGAKQGLLTPGAVSSNGPVSTSGGAQSSVIAAVLSATGAVSPSISASQVSHTDKLSTSGTPVSPRPPFPTSPAISANGAAPAAVLSPLAVKVVQQSTDQAAVARKGSWADLAAAAAATAPVSTTPRASQPTPDSATAAAPAASDVDVPPSTTTTTTELESADAKIDPGTCHSSEKPTEEPSQAKDDAVQPADLPVENQEPQAAGNQHFVQAMRTSVESGQTPKEQQEAQTTAQPETPVIVSEANITAETSAQSHLEKQAMKPDIAAQITQITPQDTKKRHGLSTRSTGPQHTHLHLPDAGLAFENSLRQAQAPPFLSSSQQLLHLPHQLPGGMLPSDLLMLPPPYPLMGQSHFQQQQQHFSMGNQLQQQQLSFQQQQQHMNYQQQQQQQQQQPQQRSSSRQLGSNAAFVKQQVPAGTPPIVGYEVDPVADRGEGPNGQRVIKEFPRRPGERICDFYSKTGHCKFGDTCVFDHPLDMAVEMTVLGLPLRPDQPLCTFYQKSNECRFGPSCKFHHPMLRPVYAGQSTMQMSPVNPDP